MKKTILSTLLIFTTAACLLAQTIIEPSTSTAEVEAEAIDVVAKSVVQNEGDKEESYRWVRTVVEITEGWETAVCDNILCWNTDINESPESFAVGAGESGILDVHVYPYGIEGSAHIELSLVRDSNGEELAKGIYLFNKEATSTLEVVRTNLVLYPNPAVDAFQVSTTVPVKQLELYNAIGRHVGTFNYAKGDVYSVADYPRGFYFVKVLSADDKIVAVKRLQKI